MELRDIRYFLVLCEELHFTRAADRCGVSQPCISAAVKKIEAELGGILIHRRPHPQLTELGRAVRPLWDEALRKVDHSLALALGHRQGTPVASPPIAPASLDDVRHALERIAAERAETTRALLAPPAPESSDESGAFPSDAVILARLRDRQIIASCRARNREVWRAGPRRPVAPRPVRALVLAAVAVALLAAAGFVIGGPTGAALWGHGGAAVNPPAPAGGP